MSQCFHSLDEIRDLYRDHEGLVSRSDRPVFGWFCSYTPVEILLAAGLYPYRIVPEPGPAMNRADAHLERSFCPYVRSCLGGALEGHYKFLDGLVVVNSCDPMRRLYDVWRYYIDGDFVSLLDLPRLSTDTAVEYFRECLQGFTGELEKHYRVKITEKKISRAIESRDRTRSLLKELYRLDRERGLPIPAASLQSVVRTGNVLPPDSYAGLLEKLLEELGNAQPEEPKGPFILITGGIMDNPLIVELIEECGGRVAGDDLCTGTRQFWQTVESGPDPLSDLSRHYLERIPCPRMKDAQKRFDHVLRLVDELGVNGVVFYTLKFCDPFLYDIPVLREQLAGRGIPCLVLEGDYTPGTLGRVRTRIEAFIEMLKQNVGAA